MTPYETLEYMLKGTNVLRRIDSAPFEIRLRELYSKVGPIPDNILKGLIDDNMTDEEINKALDKYEHLDTVIDEFSIIMYEISLM